PDYLGFNEERGIAEYPATYYEEFFHYIKTHYDGQYWNALPKEVAGWFKENYRARTPAEYVAEQTHFSRRFQKESSGFWMALKYELSKFSQNSVATMRRKLSGFDSIDFAVHALDLVIKSWTAFKKSLLKSAVIGHRVVVRRHKLSKILFEVYSEQFRQLSLLFRKAKADLRRLYSRGANRITPAAAGANRFFKKSLIDCKNAIKTGSKIAKEITSKNV